MTQNPIGDGVHDLSFSDYLDLDAWGSGALKAMRRGPPARVLWDRNNENSDTDATILGSAVHCALLTPSLYPTVYEAKPEGMNFSTKEGKAWRDDPVRYGRTLLSFETAETVKNIVQAIKDKGIVGKALARSTHREASLVWTCSISLERCKARTDWIQGEHIYDLKVSRHASSDRIAMRVFFDGWMHQLAHYRTGAVELGMPITGGRLVVVDPAPPHFVHALEVKRDALDLLEIENIDTLKRMRDCRVSRVWPGTEESWVKIEPPASAGMEAMNDVRLGDGTDEAEETI